MSDTRPTIKTMDDYEREYTKIIRDAMAQAWDEGYDAGEIDNDPGVRSKIERGRSVRLTNPYREES